MIIKIGNDILNIKKFKQSLNKGKANFLERIFSPYELKSTTKIENLAGMFAAKEAVLKALDLKPGSWQLIEILKNKNGKPSLKINTKIKILSQDISISHDGDYIIATACFLV